jgi:hypothetical protein
VIETRLAKARLRASEDLTRLIDARREVERLEAMTEPSGQMLVWSRLGYVRAEKAKVIQQTDRQRAARRTRGPPQL